MHTIRLRGPWNVEPVERFVLQADGTYRPELENLPPAVKMTMPADWSAAFGADFLGRVRYSRTFQKPSGLSGGQRVFLVVEGGRSRALVELNRKRLDDGFAWGQAFCCDISEALERSNSLEIVVEHPVLDAIGVGNDDDNIRLPGGLVGEVRLEIEETEK